MKWLTSLLMVSGVGAPAFAETKVAIELLRSQRDTLQRQIAEMEKQVDGAKRDLEGESASLNNASCPDWFGCFFRVGTGADPKKISAAASAVTEAKKKLETLEAALAKSQSEAEDLNKKLAEDDKARADLTAKVTALSNEIKASKLALDFANLKSRTGKIDDDLDAMEAALDKAIIGAYFQDKMGQLLNSQVICSAVKRCAVKDAKEIPPEQIRKELFPSTREVRSNYYQKVNKGAAAK